MPDSWASGVQTSGSDSKACLMLLTLSARKWSSPTSLYVSFAETTQCRVVGAVEMTEVVPFLFILSIVTLGTLRWFIMAASVQEKPLRLVIVLRLGIVIGNVTQKRSRSMGATPTNIDRIRYAERQLFISEDIKWSASFALMDEEDLNYCLVCPGLTQQWLRASWSMRASEVNSSPQTNSVGVQPRCICSNHVLSNNLQIVMYSIYTLLEKGRT